MIALFRRRIWIVGGAGFIGHHLAVALAAGGAQVEVVDSLEVNNLLSITSEETDPERRGVYLRMINGRLDALRDAGVRLLVLDARDAPALRDAYAAFDPQVVIHLAGVAHAGRSNREPQATFEHGLRTLENALELARGHAEHFVYFSSSMVYGNFPAAPVNEDHPLAPIGIYGAMKAVGEQLVAAYGDVFELPYTVVRPSALYGPRCVSRRVVQVFIEGAMAGEPVRVDGDGSERLDFTFVDDLVDGVCRVVTTPAARNQTFNLTYGRAQSVSDLAEILRADFPELELEHVERDRLTPSRGTLAIDKAASLLGYRPQYPIELGVPRYVESYRSLGSRKRRVRVA